MATKKKEITALEIISKYMDLSLSEGNKPISIYKFAKDLQMEESEFYKFFNSFEQIEHKIFSSFIENSISLLERNEEFETYAPKDKLLSLYFTIFENFTANRSYVLMDLNGQGSKLKSLKKLSGLKQKFIEFVNQIGIEKIDLKQEKLQKIQNKGFEEGFWVQFLLILKFWMNDTSPSFEKTDVFIEKSVHASFDMINTQPIKSFIDLGKFILKEKMDFKL